MKNKWLPVSQLRFGVTIYISALLLQESDVFYIPTSGLSGQNLTTRSAETALTAWYTGPCLLEQIGVYVR